MEAFLRADENKLFATMFRGSSGSSSEASADEAIATGEGTCTEAMEAEPAVIQYVSPLLGAPVIVETNQVLGIYSQLWPAALKLCKYIEDNMGAVFTHPICETNVLELGAGVGLCGVFFAKLGCKRVVLTDLPEAMPLLERNIQLNMAESSTSANVLRWCVLCYSIFMAPCLQLD